MYQEGQSILLQVQKMNKIWKVILISIYHVSKTWLGVPRQLFSHLPILTIIFERTFFFLQNFSSAHVFNNDRYDRQNFEMSLTKEGINFLLVVVVDGRILGIAKKNLF